MIRNYIKTAWRNLVRNKLFSLINIMGLALGVACSLLILLWVRDEYSVDAFHVNGKQLYRIYERQYFSGKMRGVIWTQGPLAAELKEKVPEIIRSTPYSWTWSQVFSAGDKVNKQQVNTAGPDFFKMFSFPLLEGSAETALKEPHSLAISKHMAGIFFGSPEKAIGKTIRYDNRKDFRITAVFDDIPANSTLQFDCLMDWHSYLEDNEWAKNWGNTDPLTFFQIRKDAKPGIVESDIRHLLDAYLPEPDKSRRTELDMQPFGEYYLHSQFDGAKMGGGRIQYVRIFLAVAFFLILIACINFTNLSTARAAKRAREIGVRKVVGAWKNDLVAQFMGEAMLTTVLAFVIAIVLVWIALPVFNNITGKSIALPLMDLKIWAVLPLMIVITALLAGAYPALFLSSLNPIGIFRELRSDRRSALFRKGLVVFQFSLSIILIAGMLVINRQVHYIQEANPGFNRENLVYLPMEGNLLNKYEVLKESLIRVPGILSVSHTTENPVTMNYGMENVKWQGANPDEKIRFTPVGVGYDYVKTMELKLASGRDFSPDFPTDTAAILVNETAVKAMGLKNPLGEELRIGNQPARIIGILRDFHFQSFHSAIRPMFLYLRRKDMEGSLLVRVDGKRMQESLAGLQSVCRSINPAYPFEFHFADKQYEKLYTSEQVVSRLSNAFAVFAIFVSCLGLLGLTIFEAEQRRKEIGIRKVLGADTGSLFLLLSREYLALVGLAILIGIPVSWWFTGNWLQEFAYRIHRDWWIYGLAGMLAVIIAWATVSWQAMLSVRANPVDSLRNE